MPLDPSIFLQGAQLQQKNAEQFQTMLQNTQENKIKRQTLAADKAGLDLDKLIQPILIKQAAGVPLAPEELAIGKAWDLSNSAKLTTDASGNYRRANAPVFGGGFDIGAVAPVGGQAQSPEQVGPPAPAGFDMGLVKPMSVPGNPNATQKGIESAVAANIDLEKQKIMTEQKKQDASQRPGEQLKAAGFANRMAEADVIMNNLLIIDPNAALAKTGKAGVTEAVLAAIPSFGMTDKAGRGLVKLAANDEQKNFLNAADEWIRAKLRKESGAVIGDQEMIDEYRTYFPVPGDGPKQIAQKAALRKTAEESLRNESAGTFELQYGDKAKGQKYPDGFKIVNDAGEVLVKRGTEWVKE